MKIVSGLRVKSCKNIGKDIIEVTFFEALTLDELDKLDILGGESNLKTVYMRGKHLAQDGVPKSNKSGQVRGR